MIKRDYFHRTPAMVFGEVDEDSDEDREKHGC